MGSVFVSGPAIRNCDGQVNKGICGNRIERFGGQHTLHLIAWEGYLRAQCVWLPWAMLGGVVGHS